MSDSDPTLSLKEAMKRELSRYRSVILEKEKAERDLLKKEVEELRAKMVESRETALLCKSTLEDLEQKVLKANAALAIPPAMAFTGRGSTTAEYTGRKATYLSGCSQSRQDKQLEKPEGRETLGHCKSSKEAQNTAAQVAFDFLTVAAAAAAATSAEPSPPPVAFSEALLHVAATPMIQPPAIAADPPLSPFPSSLPDPPPEVLHMYKNLLQQHAQKENAGLPVYTFESEGPPHARRFKSKVSLNGKSYETSKFFTTLTEAEQTAAKIACQALSVGVIQEEKGLYKNLLQELVQKKGLKCPSYETVSSGLSHNPMFVSTVEIGSESFRSVECKTRKLAEMNAAEVAYCALTKGNPPTNSSKVPPMNTLSFADNLPQNIQPTATTQKRQTSIDEEDHVLAKRAKASPGNMDVNASIFDSTDSDDDSCSDSFMDNFIASLQSRTATK